MAGFTKGDQIVKVIYNREKKIDEKIRHLDITIGISQYRLSESIDGKLTINKSDLSGTGATAISIYPRVSNEIDVK